MGTNKEIAIINYCAQSHGKQNLNEFINGKFSSLASSRIQLIPAVKACIKMGLKPVIWSLDENNPNFIDKIGTPKACLIGKLTTNKEEKLPGLAIANLSAIARLKRKKVPIGLIYSDHPIGHPDPLDSVSQLYRDLLYFSDFTIFTSKKMKSLLIEQNFHLPDFIVEDPWTVCIQPYKKLVPNECLRALWFGSPANTKFLTEILPKLTHNSQLKRGVELTILGSAYSLRQIRDAFQKYNCKNTSWRLRLVQWDTLQQPAQLEQELMRGHISLIPSDPKDLLKQGVSHNRLVDSIRGGCIPIASPMATYKELAKISIIANDFVNILNKIEINYNRLTSKHESLRDDLLERFSPENNQKKWINIIETISQ